MSELTEYWNKKKIVSRPYDPTGCPVPLGEGKCGETKGFEILMEFHKLYQDKISSIDVTAGGDSLQEKVDIQQDWINDLTEQNRLMARAIEELELEAIDKVQALEEKLLDYSKSLSEDEEKLNEKDRIIKELQESLATRTKTFDSAADISKETDKSNSLHEAISQSKLEKNKLPISHKEELFKEDISNQLNETLEENKSDINKPLRSHTEELLKEDNSTQLIKTLQENKPDNNKPSILHKEEILKKDISTQLIETLEENLPEHPKPLTGNSGTKIKTITKRALIQTEHDDEYLQQASSAEDIKEKIRDLLVESSISKFSEKTFLRSTDDEDHTIKILPLKEDKTTVVKEIKTVAIKTDSSGNSHSDLNENIDGNIVKVKKLSVQTQEDSKYESAICDCIHEPCECPIEGKDIISSEETEYALVEDGSVRDATEASPFVTSSPVLETRTNSECTNNDLNHEPMPLDVEINFTSFVKVAAQEKYDVPIISAVEASSATFYPSKQNESFLSTPGITLATGGDGKNEKVMETEKFSSQWGETLPSKDNKGTCCYECYSPSQMEELIDENNKLRLEAVEVKLLKMELDEKVKQILELNEENRSLNNLINKLKDQSSQKDYTERDSQTERFLPESYDLETDWDPYEVSSRFANPTTQKLSPTKIKVASCGIESSPIDVSYGTQYCICHQQNRTGLIISNNETPVCIDVYQRDNKGRFTSDSSMCSTEISTEDVCSSSPESRGSPGSPSASGGNVRARGGNDRNTISAPMQSAHKSTNTFECCDKSCPVKVDQGVVATEAHSYVRDIPIRCDLTLCDDCHDLNPNMDFKGRGIMCKVLDPTGVLTFCTAKTCANEKCEDRYESSPGGESTDCSCRTDVLSSPPSFGPDFSPKSVCPICTCVPLSESIRHPFQHVEAATIDKGVGYSPPATLCEICGQLLTEDVEDSNESKKTCTCPIDKCSYRKSYCLVKVGAQDIQTIKAETLKKDVDETKPQKISLRSLNEEGVCPQGQIDGACASTCMYGQCDVCGRPIDTAALIGSKYPSFGTSIHTNQTASVCPVKSSPHNMPCEPCICANCACDALVGTNMGDMSCAGVAAEPARALCPSRCEICGCALGPPIAEFSPDTGFSKVAAKPSAGSAICAPCASVFAAPAQVAKRNLCDTCNAGACAIWDMKICGKNLESLKMALLSGKIDAIRNAKMENLPKYVCACTTETQTILEKDVIKIKDDDICKDCCAKVGAEKMVDVQASGDMLMSDTKCVSCPCKEANTEENAVEQEYGNIDYTAFEVVKSKSTNPCQICPKVCSENCKVERSTEYMSTGDTLPLPPKIAKASSKTSEALNHSACLGHCKLIQDPQNSKRMVCIDDDSTSNPSSMKTSCICGAVANFQSSAPMMADKNTDYTKFDVEKAIDDANDCDCQCESLSQSHKSSSFKMKQEAQRTMTDSVLVEDSKSVVSKCSSNKLSKEEEYAGLSRKETERSRGNRLQKFVNRRASSESEKPDNDRFLKTESPYRREAFEARRSSSNADLKLTIAELKSQLLDAEEKIEELKMITNSEMTKDKTKSLILGYTLEIEELKKQVQWNKIEKEEYEYLKKKVKTLQNTKGDSEYVNNNLQTADDKIIMQSQLKKLSKKNKCYEEVVQFFKNEMSTMSQELLALQEVLNATNLSSQEENSKLVNAIMQLRRINDRLVSHLCAIEKQVVLENQINQINEQRINELQHIIGTKNHDLSQHDEIIREMRRKLSSATKQNTDLKKTIKTLTDTVIEIQQGMDTVRAEQDQNNKTTKMVESRICLASGDLQEIKQCMEQKNSRIQEMEKQIKVMEMQHLVTKKELELYRVQESDKKNNKELVFSLKEQLTATESKNKKLVGDFKVLMKQLQEMSNIQNIKNYELSHYKCLFQEMKRSLIHMNEGLSKCEASSSHINTIGYRNCDVLSDILEQTSASSLSGVFTELKKSMAQMQQQISEADIKGGLIEEEMKRVKSPNLSSRNDVEYITFEKKLEEKIRNSMDEQKRLITLVEDQKREIARLKREILIYQTKSQASLELLKNDNKFMEITTLKSELNKSLQRQVLLNDENEKLHGQMVNLKTKLSIIEQEYDLLKQKNEELKMNVKRITREKEIVILRNQELSRTFVHMKSTQDQLEKQCRGLVERLSHDKDWRKTPMQQPFSPRHYGRARRDTKTKISNTSLNRIMKDSSSPCRLSPALRDSEDLYMLDDRNTSSKFLKNINYDSMSSRSPASSRSPSPKSRRMSMNDDELDPDPSMILRDWFSPHYREADTDENEEDLFMNKIQVMTAQVQEANKRWQKKIAKDKSLGKK